MDLYFYLKGENGKLEDLGMYTFEEEELEKLKMDFVKYCQDSNSMKGGWYKCKDTKKDRIVFLKFDEISFIG
jgi:hypothetical protein